MSFISQTFSFFHVLFQKQKVEDDLDAELHAYFTLLVDRYLDQGLPLEEAQRKARMEFEGIERVKDEVREVRVGSAIESVPQDVRYAWRALRKSPGFTAIAVLTLALGIGVNAAIFSVVYAVLVRPLPYDRPEQLALIWSTFDKSGASHAPTSGTILDEIRQGSRLLQDTAGIWVTVGTFTGEANPEQVKVARVTTNFLSLLGVRPALGRVFTPDEGGGRAIILSNGLWRRRFGADPNIVGKGVAFEGASATVIGVMPDYFQLHFPPDSAVPADVQAFTAFSNEIYKGPRKLYYLRVASRLKPGLTFPQAQQDLNQVAAQIRGAYTEFADENLKLDIVSMHRDSVRDLRPALIALFAGAGFVMLICCVNVANLLLARASNRRKEIAVRSALGASQRRILRQLLLEGVLMCAIAGTAGLALGWAALRALVRLRPDSLARMGDIGLNLPVLVFAASVSMASVLLFGLAPSIESAKWNLIGALREAGRTTQTPARRGVRSALIVCEITLGFILVIGAGLMIRTFAKIQQVRPGFEPQSLLTFSINLGGRRFPNAALLFNFVREWEAQLSSLPGVESVGAASHLPLDDYPNWYSPYRPEGVSANQGATLIADHRSTTPDYLRAMGTRLIEGRYFGPDDRAGGRQVVIVDDLLANTTWPGQSAIGKRLESEHFTSQGIVPVWTEVVGVVEHVRNHSLSKQVRPEIYIPFEQSPRSPLSYAVRTRVDPLSLADPIRELLRKHGTDIAISKVRPMTAYVEQAKAPVSFTATLAGIFAALALLLAAIGIYGVVYYSVSTRMHEMGVRMALGASGRDVMNLVMREGLVLTAVGMLVGIGGALLASRQLQSMLYGISPLDPVTYGTAIAVIPVAAIMGCWRPAAKAAGANPVDAIRAE